MIHNKPGREKVNLQLKQRNFFKKMIWVLLAFSLLSLIFLPGWFKFTALALFLLSYIADKFTRQRYEDILFLERDKERIAIYLRKGLPECNVLVNPQVCNPYPDLLITGPTGVFAVLITADLSFGMKQDGDGEALAIQTVLQRCLSPYSAEVIILLTRAIVLKPAASRISILSSRFALINRIRRNDKLLTREEQKDINALLKSQLKNAS